MEVRIKPDIRPISELHLYISNETKNPHVCKTKKLSVIPETQQEPSTCPTVPMMSPSAAFNNQTKN